MNTRNIFISILMVVLAVYGGVKAWMYFNAKGIMDDMAQDMRKIGVNVTYDRIATSVLGTVGVQGLKFNLPALGEEVRFGEVTIFNQDFERGKDKIPTRLRLYMEKISFSLNLLDKLGVGHQEGASDEILKELGYDEFNRRSNDLRRLGYSNIVMDLSIDVQIRPSLGEIAGYSNVSIENLGSYRVYMNLNNINFNNRSAYLNVRLKEFRVDYQDASYFDRILKSLAEDQGMDLETYRAKILENLDTEITKREIKLSPESVQNLKDFIRKPDRIIVSMYPYEPVSLISIKHYKASDVPQVLNLRFLKSDK